MMSRGASSGPWWRAHGFVVGVAVLAFALRAGTVLWLADTVPYSDFAFYHVAGAEIARDPGSLFDSPSLDDTTSSDVTESPDVSSPPDATVSPNANAPQNANARIPQLHWWPPGYPIVLGGVYALFGVDHRHVVWVQVLLGTLVCVFVYGLVSRWAGIPVARTAALLVAINPTYIFLTNQLASENVFMFWLALGLWLLSTMSPTRDDDLSSRQPALANSSVWVGIATGAVFGLAALTRAVGLVVPIFLALWTVVALVRRRLPSQLPSPLPPQLSQVAWLLLGLVVVVAPWSIRNALAVGKPAIVSFGGGVNFYFGHNENHIGYRDLGSTPLAAIRDPGELDTEGYRLGFEFIRARPLEDALNGVHKVASLYAFPDYALHVNSGILIPDFKAHPELADDARARLARQRQRDRILQGPLTFAARAYHVVLLALALAGCLRWRHLTPELRFTACLVAAWTLTHVVYWAQPRFRVPIEALLVLLAAAGQVSLTNLIRHSDAGGIGAKD